MSGADSPLCVCADFKRIQSGLMACSSTTAEFLVLWAEHSQFLVLIGVLDSPAALIQPLRRLHFKALIQNRTDPANPVGHPLNRPGLISLRAHTTVRRPMPAQSGSQKVTFSFLPVLQDPPSRFGGGVGGGGGALLSTIPQGLRPKIRKSRRHLHIQTLEFSDQRPHRLNVQSANVHHHGPTITAHFAERADVVHILY